MCTISKAQKVVLAVFLICLLSVCPTFLEWRVHEALDPETNEVITEVVPTDIGKDETFKSAYYWFTAIMFIFVPLTSLVIFNSFLISSVRRASSQRKKLASEQKGTAQKGDQETKITIMLASVVVVFLFTQLPSAMLLVWSKFVDYATPEFNILIGLNNLSNFLMAVNSCVNFMLYCCLSDKFRRTFKVTFCRCCRSARQGKYYRAGFDSTATSQAEMTKLTAADRSPMMSRASSANHVWKAPPSAASQNGSPTGRANNHVYLAVPKK